jgi:hypothetical protein
MADNTKILTLTLQVKDDGSVVVDTVKKKIEDLGNSTASGGKSIADALGSVKAGWLAAAGGAAAAYASVKEFLDAASEAEQIESRMAFQLSTVGYQFQEIKPYVDEFADSILRTTRFSDEMARQSLGQMMQYTGSVEEGMNGVRLAMDMATQTGQDLGSTTRFVGMAMNGNAEILGRWIPELRDLDSKLGSNATSAEKAAYAVKILNEKFGGASQTDVQTYSGQIANLKNQYDELKEAAGKALMPVARMALSFAKNLLDVPLLLSGSGIPTYADIAAQDEAKRKANEQARINAAAKAYADDLAQWKATQEQRQAMNYQFAMQEWQIKKNTMALIDAEEFQAIEKAKKYGADLNQIKNFYHLKRLEQIRKEKEEEQTAMLSLATMWKGYYDERISRENEIINLVKGLGIGTTVGAKSEFASIQEEFRKISEQAGMFTPEEMAKIKAAYEEKLKAVSPWEGGKWEEVIAPTGQEMGPSGARTTWGAESRWEAATMDEEQRRIEEMREQALKNIEGMFKGAAAGTPAGIAETFDQTRQKALDLQQTIDEIKNQKLQIDTSRLIEAMNQIDQFEGKLIDLISGDYKIKVGVEIVGDELIQKIENELASRWANKQSGFRSVVEDSVRRE